MKRAHTKSRLGCSSCKKRRVRCDELRPECLNCTKQRSRGVAITCSYDNNSSSSTPGRRGSQASRRASSGSLIPGHGAVPAHQLSPDVGASSTHASKSSLELIPEGTGTDSARLLLPPPPSSSMLISPTQFPDVLAQDRYLFAHGMKITEALKKGNGHSIAFGSSLMPVFLRLAHHHELVRTCIFGLAAKHISLLTKSASMAQEEIRYRSLAIRSLIDSISNGSEALDAMLAASILLSWQAPDSREYMHTMEGVSTLLAEMKNRNHESELRTLFTSSIQAASVPMSMSRSDGNPDALQKVSTALRNLERYSKADAEITRGAKELRAYVENLCANRSSRTPRMQLEALFPIRNWLLWLPSAPYRMNDRDPLLMLFFAHYEMVAVAIQPLLPSVGAFLAVDRRVDTIERVDMLLAKLEVETSVETARGAVRRGRKSGVLSMDAPREYAMRYRAVEPMTGSPPESLHEALLELPHG